MIDSFGWFESFYRTPPLWRGSLMDISQFYLGDLEFPQSFQEDKLNMPHTPYGTVLGKRAERYFSFAVQQSLNYDILLENIQVQGARRTLGELDFVLWDRERQRAVHVELVYKFYLFTPSVHRLKKPLKHLPPQPWNHLIGPAGRDTFVAKMARLRRQQLPLLFQKETAVILDKLGLKATDIEQKVCFLGNIFIRDFADRDALIGVNLNCVQGSYLAYSAFAKSDTTTSNSAIRYYLPHKREWPMPVKINDEDQTNFSQLLEDIKAIHKRQHACLVWRELPDSTVQKCFVLPDQLYDRLISD